MSVPLCIDHAIKEQRTTSHTPLPSPTVFGRDMPLDVTVTVTIVAQHKAHTAVCKMCIPGIGITECIDTGQVGCTTACCLRHNAAKLICQQDLAGIAMGQAASHR